MRQNHFIIFFTFCQGGHARFCRKNPLAVQGGFWSYCRAGIPERREVRQYVLKAVALILTGASRRDESGHFRCCPAAEDLLRFGERTFFIVHFHRSFHHSSTAQRPPDGSVHHLIASFPPSHPIPPSDTYSIALSSLGKLTKNLLRI